METAICLYQLQRSLFSDVNWKKETLSGHNCIVLSFSRLPSWSDSEGERKYLAKFMVPAKGHLFPQKILSLVYFQRRSEFKIDSLRMVVWVQTKFICMKYELMHGCHSEWHSRNCSDVNEHVIAFRGSMGLRCQS